MDPLELRVFRGLPDLLEIPVQVVSTAIPVFLALPVLPVLKDLQLLVLLPHQERPPVHLQVHLQVQVNLKNRL